MGLSLHYFASGKYLSLGALCLAEGVLDIIDACGKLGSINLTSCRGIRVQERRRFFEVRRLMEYLIDIEGPSA